MNEKEKIMQIASERRIENLIHFSNAINIPNILSYGLLPRDELDYDMIDYDFNDELRLENLYNAISVSITFPNYKRFYKLRCDNPSKRWVVFILDAEYVLTLDCAFCRTNAANSEVSTIPINFRKTISSFEGMFAEVPNKPSRNYLRLFDNEPTDPQAEILVFDRIPVSAIQYAIFFDYETQQQYKPLLDFANIPCAVDRGYFYPRRDYSHW